MGRFVGIFGDVHATIKRRNNKLLDYDALRSKVRKLADKPSEDASKLPRTEALALDAKTQYETQNQVLIDEIPKLIDVRNRDEKKERKACFCGVFCAFLSLFVLFSWHFSPFATFLLLFC